MAINRWPPMHISSFPEIAVKPRDQSSVIIYDMRLENRSYKQSLKRTEITQEKLLNQKVIIRNWNP